MKRVTGIGGVFFKADDPEKFIRLVRAAPGAEARADGQGVSLHWRDPDDPRRTGMTVWALFKKDSKYFEPSRSSFMINYRVDDFDALLAALKEEGVETDPKREDYDYGRFAWIMDPEGTRIELWEPPKGE